MNYAYRCTPLLFGLLLCFSSAVFSNPVEDQPKQLLRHVEGLSRDYFYIDFSHHDSSYKQQSIVGGEHEKHYLVLGFLGDRFKVVIQSEEGDVGYVRGDEEIVIESQHWDEQNQRSTMLIRVVEQQTWIDVSLSAHPFASYSIEISPLARAPL